MARKKFKTAKILVSGEDYQIELEYKLIRSPLTDIWIKHILPCVQDQSNLVHLGSASTPTPERLTRHWDIVRHFTHLANQDHLLDEWIHLPAVLDLGSDYHALFNNLRYRCQAFEKYADANNQASDTRTNLMRVSRAISTFEHVLNAPVDNPRKAFWFKSINSPPQTAAIDANKYLVDSIAVGDLVMLSSGVSRTPDEARLANDSNIVKRNMILPWATSSVTLLSFSNYAEDITKTRQWLTEIGKDVAVVPTFCKIGKLSTPVDDDEILKMLATAKITKITLE
jgi:hypothetical protein